MSRKSFTLQELAELTDSKLEGDPNYSVFNVADLETATAQDISFLSNPKYEKLIHSSKAGVIFVNEGSSRKTGRNYLIHKQPSAGFQKVLEAFYTKSNAFTGFSGIHSSAIIHSTCTIGNNVTIGPRAVLDENVVIGENSFIGAGVYVGPETEIGENTCIHPNVTIRERCKIGNRVIIQPGAVIGSCGFGYLTSSQGKHIKLNQVGSVFIEDDVEIGANTTIDRARFKETIIGKGSKLDNLVQIAHGASIGPDNILIAQTGIAGSSKTGNRVVMGGQSAIAGHLQVGDDVIIAARGGVTKSLLKKGTYGGLPAISIEEHRRNSVYLRNIEAFVKKLNQLLSDVKENQND